jgi:hypothetical protein
MKAQDSDSGYEDNDVELVEIRKDRKLIKELLRIIKNKSYSMGDK